MIRKILLMGNPNVGKSVIFSRLTGVYVIASNYPGTTVEFSKGYIRLDGEKVEVIDVPGTYTLQPTTTAEEVAVRMLEEAIGKKEAIVINVVDATNLERNLYLTLQLLKRDIPLIIALNLWDEAGHIGISIDVEKLAGILGVPIVPTVAITGEGIRELKEKIPQAQKGNYNYEERQIWQEIGKIINSVQKVKHRHHTFLERLGDITIRPVTGLPFAFLILYLTFWIVRVIGEGLTNYLLDPVFNNLYLPLITRTLGNLSLPKFIANLFLGRTPEALKSFGILTTGLYIPFVVVLPYLFSFYFVLSLLEDIGYLPRLATLLDTFLHYLGLHGYSAIPVILGFGCKVPGILSTRILETKREKIITTALIMMSAPCMPQTAMIVSLISPYGTNYLLFIFGILFSLGLLTSLLLSRILKGETPSLFLEIPPYRLPRFSPLFKKVGIRLNSFLREAVPLIIGGVLLIGILEQLGVIDLFAQSFARPITYLLGLPDRAIGVIITGFLRKDIAIALLKPLALSPTHLIIASIFLTLYLPCLATFFILLKELGCKDTLKVIAILLASGLFVGGILNLILR